MYVWGITSSRRTASDHDRSQHVAHITGQSVMVQLALTWSDTRTQHGALEAASVALAGGPISRLLARPDVGGCGGSWNRCVGVL